jgi:beta-N-acetylhexosaminidase
MSDIINETTKLAGRFFIFGFEDEKLNDRMRRFIEFDKISGLILFKRNIESIDGVKKLNDEIKSTASYPILIGIDEEGGRVSRFNKDEFQTLPSMQYLAQNHTVKEAQEMAKSLALKLRDLGFNFNFAPVLDIFSNPQNEVIGDRAFGSDVDTVIKYSIPIMKGFQEGGVLTCGKHFPGHGDTLLDSHKALPKLKNGLDVLRKREFLPFQEAINQGIDSIMTAHILFEELDVYPATFSKLFLNDLLRNELNFKEVIVSDDLDMNAIKNEYDIKDVIFKGIEAGVDLFIVSKNDQDMQQAVLESVKQMISNRDISIDRLIESMSRIDRMVYKTIE